MNEKKEFLPIITNKNDFNESEDDDDGKESVFKYWEDQFKKEEGKMSPIEPNFDLFSEFLANNFANQIDFD